MATLKGAFADLLVTATHDVTNALSAIASSPDFLEQLVLAYGDHISQDVADELRQQFLTGTYELPEIEVISATDLAGAQGTYAAANRTIYLSDALFADPTPNLERVVAVLLEEIGHDLDTRLNRTDAPGDEGEIFSALVRGKPLEAQQLQALQAEDDQTTLVIGGRSLQVEHADHKPIAVVKNLWNDIPDIIEKEGISIRYYIGTTLRTSTDVELYYSFTGSATPNIDYLPFPFINGSVTPLNGSFTVRGGVGPATFSDVKDDAILEPDETITIALRESPTGSYEIDPNENSLTFTIKDNDVLPVARIEKVLDTKEPDPGGQVKAGQFKVTLSSPALEGTKVSFTVDGSAQEGTDFNQLTGIDQTRSVTFRPGQTEALIDIIPKRDYNYEPNGESVTLTLKEPAVDPTNPNFGGKSYTIAGSTSTSASLTIDDNNVIPEVRIERSEGKPTESKFLSSAVYGSFYVKLTAPALNGGLTIPYTVSGTATPGIDHNLLQSGVLTIPEGSIDDFKFLVPIDDAIVDPDETVIITLTPPTAGQLYTLNPDKSSVTFTIQDNDVAGVSIVSLDYRRLTTYEDGRTDNFIVSLFSEPTHDVTLTFTGLDETEGKISANSVTFTPLNWDTYQRVYVTGVGDNELDGTQTYTLKTIASSEDPVYNNIAVDDITVTNFNTDVPPGVSVEGSKTATEGGESGTFTIKLTKPALKGGVTVNYSLLGTATNPEDYELPKIFTGSVTLAEGQTSVPISIIQKDDFIAEGDESIVLRLTGATGAYLLYGESPRDNQAQITLRDNDTAGLTISPVSGATTEAGGQATFTIQLNSQPKFNVGVNVNSRNGNEGLAYPYFPVFTPSNWNIPQLITITGQDDFRVDGDKAYNIAISPTSIDPNYNNLEVPDVSVVNLDIQGFRVLITQTDGNTSVTEGTTGSTDTYQVALSRVPSGAVEITVTADAQSLVSVDGRTFSQSVTFSRTDKTPQTITVRAVDDTAVEGSHTSSISHAITGTVVDSNYPKTLAIAPVTVQITDNDVPTVNIRSTELATEKSAVPGKFNLQLSAPAPVGGITVNYEVDSDSTATPDNKPSPLGAGEPDYYALTRSVFIPANATGAFIEVIPTPDDQVKEAIETVKINLLSGTGYTVGDAESGTVNINDDDIPGVSIPSFSNPFALTEGRQDSYRIRLTSQPKGTVTLALTSTPEAGLQVDKPTLTFTPTNWKDSQTVTVSVREDNRAQGDRTGTITHTITSSTDPDYTAALVVPPLTVQIADNDKVGVNLNETNNSTVMVEGGADTYSLVLTSEPTGDVIITPVLETGLTIDKPTLTFTATNWNQPQLVTVSALDDKRAQGDRTSTITHTISSSDPAYNKATVAPRPITVQIRDDDRVGITLSETNNSSILLEGGNVANTYTVKLDSQPTANVTVTLTVPPNLGLQTDKTTLAFTPDTWNQPQTVFVFAPEDAIAWEFFRTLNIAHTVSSDDSQYNGLSLRNVAVRVFDNDTAGIEVVQSNGTTMVQEGGSGDSFTVKLKSQPIAPVTIQLGTSQDWTTDVSSLTFTAQDWNTPKTVTVAAIEDQNTEPQDIVPLTFAVSSGDATYNNWSINPVPVTVKDVGDRVLQTEETQALGNLFRGVLNDLDTQLQNQLNGQFATYLQTTFQSSEIPLVGSLDSISNKLMPFKDDLIQTVEQLGGSKVSEFISQINSKLKAALPDYLKVTVDGGLAIKDGIGFNLSVTTSLLYEVPLNTDLGSSGFGLEVDGKLQLGATATLKLGFGLKDRMAGFLPVVKASSTSPSPVFRNVKEDQTGILGYIPNQVGQPFIDTEETSFSVNLGARLGDGFKAKGFLGPLTATLRDDQSNSSTRTQAGISLEVGLEDADIGAGYKFFDANKNGKLDGNERETGLYFVGNAKDVTLRVLPAFDLNKNKKYDPNEGTEVVLLQTTETKDGIKPILYTEPSLFPQPSVRWFDVNNTGFVDGFEPLGGLKADGTFDLEVSDRFDSNDNGFYDRDDRYQNSGTLYTFVPDYALQFDQQSPSVNPNTANGFRFLDANENQIWDYKDLNGNGTEDPGEREPWIKSVGQSFPLKGFIQPAFDLNKDGSYDEADGEGRTYTLWAVKSRPAILFADNNGDGMFSGTTNQEIFLDGASNSGSFVGGAAEPFVNALPDGTFPVVPTLDKNDNGRYDAGDGKLLVLRDDGDRLSATEFTNNSALNKPLAALFLDQFKANFSVTAKLGLQAEVGLDNLGAGLPSLQAEVAVAYTPFRYEFKERKGQVIKNDPTKPKLTASLNNIRLDLGSWLGKQVQPFAKEADTYIKPIRPIVNALQSEVTLISTLGLTPAFDINKDGKATVLEIAGSIAKVLSPEQASKIDESIKSIDRWLTVVQTVANYIEILSEFKEANNTGIFLNFGSISYPKAAKVNAGRLTNQEVTKQLETLNKSATPQQQNLIGKAKSFLSDGIIQPLILSNIPGLIQGEDVPLLGLQLPPFILDFNVSKTFPIWGPISGLLEGNFRATLNLDLGFDTSGINRLVREIKGNTFDAIDSLLPLDGIYLSDRTNVDGTGSDRPEATLDASVAVGAGIDIGVVAGYIKGGIQGNANLDLIDVGETIGQSDGRIHVSEIVQQARGGLWNVFRLYGGVNAFLGAQIKAVGITVYETNLVTLPLFTFDVGPKGSKVGSIFDGYTAGSFLFFDADFDNQWDLEEPSTYTNADGSYTLDIPLAIFDINQNGVLDANEGQLVAIDGVDTSTTLPQTVPMTASGDATVVTPLTTLIAELSEANVEAAETELQRSLGLAALEVDLRTFDATDAIRQTSNTNQQTTGLQVLAARAQLETFLIRGTKLFLDAQSSASSLTASTIANALLDAIATTIQANATSLLTLSADTLQSLLNNALTRLQTQGLVVNKPDALTIAITTTAEAIAQDVTQINLSTTDTTVSPADAAVRTFLTQGTQLILNALGNAGTLSPITILTALANVVSQAINQSSIGNYTLSFADPAVVETLLSTAIGNLQTQTGGLQVTGTEVQAVGDQIAAAIGETSIVTDGFNLENVQTLALQKFLVRGTQTILAAKGSENLDPAAVTAALLDAALAVLNTDRLSFGDSTQVKALLNTAITTLKTTASDLNVSTTAINTVANQVTETVLTDLTSLDATRVTFQNQALQIFIGQATQLILNAQGLEGSLTPIAIANALLAAGIAALTSGNALALTDATQVETLLSSAVIVLGLSLPSSGLQTTATDIATSVQGAIAESNLSNLPLQDRVVQAFLLQGMQLLLNAQGAATLTISTAANTLTETLNGVVANGFLLPLADPDGVQALLAAAINALQGEVPNLLPLENDLITTANQIAQTVVQTNTNTDATKVSQQGLGIQNLLTQGIQLMQTNQSGGSPLTAKTIATALLREVVDAIADGNAFSLGDTIAVQTVLLNAISDLQANAGGLTVADAALQTVSSQIAQNAEATTITDLQEVSTQAQALQVFLAQGIQLVQAATGGAGLTEAVIANALLNAVVPTVSGTPLPLEDAAQVQSWLTSAIDTLQQQTSGLAVSTTAIAATANRIATSISIQGRAQKIADAVSLLDTADALSGSILVDLFGRLTTKLATVERTPIAANTLVTNAFGLSAELNLNTYDAIQAAEQGDANGLVVFAKQVQVQNLAVQLTELSQGLDASQSDLAAANRVTETVADYVATQPANSLQDLSQPDVLQPLVTQVVPNLSLAISTRVAEVIAAGNAAIDAIVRDSSLNTDAKLTQIAQVQYVVQKLVAEDLNKVGAGTKDIDTLVNAYTGANLDDQIDQAANTINNPAQRTNINNRAPVAAADAFSTNGSVLTITAAQLLANDTDADGDLLQITQLTAPGGLTGTVSLNATAQTITYKSPAGFVGIDSFFYIVTDGKGGVNTAEATITVTANLVTGSNGRDNLTGLGTDGSDRIIGGPGSDILKGGGSGDVFAYTSVRDAGDRIVDFTIGEDVIELTQLLDSIVPGGYSGTDAIVDGYIKLIAQGNNTILQLDQDGVGRANTFRNFLTVENVSVSAMSNLSNFIF
jgi:hypothetical protein